MNNKRATERYTWAVNELTRQGGTEQLEDYDKLVFLVQDLLVAAGEQEEIGNDLPALGRQGKTPHAMQLNFG